MRARAWKKNTKHIWCYFILSLCLKNINIWCCFTRMRWLNLVVTDITIGVIIWQTAHMEKLFPKFYIQFFLFVSVYHTEMSMWATLYHRIKKTERVIDKRDRSVHLDDKVESRVNIKWIRFFLARMMSKCVAKRNLCVQSRQHFGAGWNEVLPLWQRKYFST